MATIASLTLNADNINNNGVSIRNFITAQSQASLGQVRVTFRAATGVGWQCNNTSIAVKGAATAPNVSSTFGGASFLELKFSGASGFSIASAASITSDWLTFTSGASDVLAVIMDMPNPGPDATDIKESTNGGAAAAGWYHNSPAASFNQSTVTGYTTVASPATIGVSLIETQGSGGGGQIFVPRRTLLNVGWTPLFGLGAMLIRNKPVTRRILPK